ncbi:MAG: PA4642 family protein [Pseudomonadales bacterium]|nr:PA4642 family protein [Pseudomonadales bacterium]MDP4640438.1 PA4642 family protein [Pseudomonadales bacterium]MDP4766035.1 PA4642 family protein [Pseudomonadales bacterium]MDP4910938.1 PA4642 family protein [Pseudomonadales bacterium]MDP5059445.1 PA4642 family protein [Pseudomonadales bacterium]
MESKNDKPLYSNPAARSALPCCCATVSFADILAAEKTIMAGPTQPQVTDEVWDDDRVKSFLDMQSYGDAPQAFHILLKAYRGMRPADFKRFMTFFVDAGHNPDATDKAGRTLWEIIQNHRQGADFIQVRNQLA